MTYFRCRRRHHFPVENNAHAFRYTLKMSLMLYPSTITLDTFTCAHALCTQYRMSLLRISDFCHSYTDVTTRILMRIKIPDFFTDSYILYVEFCHEGLQKNDIHETKKKKNDWRKRNWTVGKLAAPCGPTARVQLGTGPSLLPGKVKYTGSDRSLRFPTIQNQLIYGISKGIMSLSAPNDRWPDA
ncbi:hypothetical protein ACI65C_004214 [Semiaphis heraclei]